MFISGESFDDVTSLSTNIQLVDFPSDISNHTNVKNLGGSVLKPPQKNKNYDRPYHCICDKTFAYHSALIKHRKSHKINFQPKIRNIQTVNFKKAKKVASTKNRFTDGPFQCEYCAKNFIQFSTLITHRKTHANKKAQESLKFKNNSQQKNRMTPTIFEEKAHECKLCFQRFDQRKNLTNHKKSHVVQKPFTCEICPKKVSTHSLLIKHRKIHL